MRFRNLFKTKSSWLRCWKQRFMFLVALLLPGMPQLFRQQIVAGGLLLVFGCGAGLDLAQCLMASRFRPGAFDLLYTFVAEQGNPAFPNVQEVAGAAGGHLRQPYFWYWLIGHLVVYVACAALSGWLQWQNDKNER